MRAVILTCLAGLLVAPMAARADGFIRKGGEWRTVTSGVGPTPTTMDLCFSEATVEQAMAKLADHKDCTKHDIRANGNSVTIDLVCGGMSMRGSATFSGDSAYHADLTMQVGAGAQAKTFHSLSDATWIGPCKAGEKPLN